MSPPKHVDLLALVAASAVFVIGGFPLVGFAAGAGIWLAQRVVQMLAARRAAVALADGDRKRAMGTLAATTLGRVWMMTLAVLLTGLLADRDAGLAAAVLVAGLFTLSMAARGIAHLFGDEQGELHAAPRVAGGGTPR